MSFGWLGPIFTAIGNAIGHFTGRSKEKNAPEIKDAAKRQDEIDRQNAEAAAVRDKKTKDIEGGLSQ